jgi:hypothetical protein
MALTLTTDERTELELPPEVVLAYTPIIRCSMRITP